MKKAEVLMEKVNILAIGAHPDDIEFGCAGALIKYAEKGRRQKAETGEQKTAACSSGTENERPGNQEPGETCSNAG